MQAIAREMNLSETTFVTPPEAGGTHTCASSPPRSSCRSPDTPASARPASSSGSAIVAAVDARHATSSSNSAWGRRWSRSRCATASPSRPPSIRARRASAPRRVARRPRPSSASRPATCTIELDPMPVGTGLDVHGHPAARPRCARAHRARRGAAPRLRSRARRGLPVRVHRGGRPVDRGSRPVPLRRHRRGPGDRQRGRAARRLSGAGRPARAGRGAGRAAGPAHWPSEPARRERRGRRRRASKTCSSAARCSPSCRESSACRADRIICLCLSVPPGAAVPLRPRREPSTERKPP